MGQDEGQVKFQKDLEGSWTLFKQRRYVVCIYLCVPISIPGTRPQN